MESGTSAMKGGGAPLSGAERSFYEPRFGHDFSNVRVHTGPLAHEAAKSINARAFTHGSDITFASGEYAPGTEGGKRLIAHELTHVVQQEGNSFSMSPVPSGLVQRAGPAIPATLIVIGRVVAKCIIGAITGVLFDVAIQAALNALKKRTWKLWKVSLNICSLILSAILSCITTPLISAYALEKWIGAKLGTRLGGMAGTLIGKILMYIAKKLGVRIPKVIVGKLLKLNCISKEQATELKVK